MNANEFKNKIIEIKDLIKSKELVIEVSENSKVETFNYSSLRLFGLKILELEIKGFCFIFSSVSHERADFNIVDDVKKSNQRKFKTSFDRTLDYCINNVPFKTLNIKCYKK